MQAPNARAMVDIAQHRDGRLALNCRGQALRFKRCAGNGHLSRSELADAKTVDQRVDQAAHRVANNAAESAAAKAAGKERKRLARQHCGVA